MHLTDDPKEAVEYIVTAQHVMKKHEELAATEAAARRSEENAREEQ